MLNKMERFTQRARRVLSLAQEEAIRLQHKEIDTGHLLLGLISEETGLAGRVLRDLGAEHNRAEVLLKMDHPPAETPFTQVELSSQIKKSLELAVEEARQMGHRYIGTEHLLLGLIRQEDTAASRVLGQLGIKPEEIRRRIQEALA